MGRRVFVFVFFLFLYLCIFVFLFTGFHLAVGPRSSSVSRGIECLPSCREDEQGGVLKFFTFTFLWMLIVTLSISLLLMLTLVTSSKPRLGRREGGGLGRLLLAKS